MEILNLTEGSFMVDDDLLNFTLEEEEEEEEEEQTTVFNLKGHFSSSQSTNPSTTIIRTETQNASFPEFVEEELEWLSNKDAFPSVETCFGILSDNPELMMNRQSPVSVLESSSSSSNSNTNGSSVTSWCGSFKFPANYPGRARSKRRRKIAGFGDFPGQQFLWSNEVKVENKKQESESFSLQPSLVMVKNGAGMGRRCLHCQSDKTPQWRAGPMGPKTLCNACGVRFKSGRLLPEYRPASSPTFSSTLHSNSHRKVVEMRRQKKIGPDGIVGNEACGYKVG